MERLGAHIYYDCDYLTMLGDRTTPHTVPNEREARRIFVDQGRHTMDMK
jgi:hypothetical protein